VEQIRKKVDQKRKKTVSIVAPTDGSVSTATTPTTTGVNKEKRITKKDYLIKN